MKVKILGKTWNLLFQSKGLRNQFDGICKAPDKPASDRNIIVRDGLQPRKELRILLHECLHAADWHKDEEWIDRVSRDLTKILWDLGWRKTG